MNLRAWAVFVLGASLLQAAPASAATPLPGFPRRVPGNLPGKDPALVSTPVALDTSEGGRIFFAAGEELHCLTLAGSVCDGFPARLGEKVGAVGAPAVGDVDGDKKPEIAVALSDGRLVLFHGDGTVVSGFALKETSYEAGPSILEIAGKTAVVIGSKGGKVHALSASGAELPGFPISLPSTVTSSVAAALFGNPAQQALVTGNEDGKVYVTLLNGHSLPGFPIASAYLVSGEPAVGDLDGDGLNEVAFASQDFKVYAVKSEGKAYNGFPAAVGARIMGGAALGDLAGDGKLEIVAAALDGKLHAFNLAGEELPGFPVKLGEKLVGSAVMADLDRDGKDEILTTTLDGQVHAVRGNGRTFPGFPARLTGEPVGGPAVMDWGDGVVVVQAAGDKVFAFKVKRTGKSTAPLAWAEQGHDAARTGRVHPNPPGYADLKITPPAPNTDDTLTAEYRFFDLDGDPEPATEIRWFKDGREVSELAGKKSVPKEATRKKEKWRFQVTAPGATLRQSPEAVIVNSRPGRARVGFEPEVLRRAQAVKVKILEDAPDADGDKVSYSYTWLKDGQVQKGLNKPELPAGAIKKAERWSVVVTASDGEAEGLTATAEATVADSPPTAPEIALAPAQPKAGDAVKVVIQKQATDADGDPLKYRYHWSVDGQPLALASSFDTLPPFSARKRQVVGVEVQADDGELLGPVAKAQATVVNTAPTVPVPSVVPREPRRGDTLIAGLAAPAQDIDGDKLSFRFAFTKGGKLAGAAEVSGIKKGETYEVSAIANDGEADSMPGKATATVKNTPPGAPGIAFETMPLRRADPVKVKIVEPAVDPDGDPVSYRYSWSKNGAVQHGLDKAELPAGTVKKAERWKVTVTPFDGEAEGTPSFLEAIVADSAPGAPEIALSPASPKIGEAVKAVIKREAADVDGDKLKYQYRFLVDGTPMAAELAADTLPAQRAHKKQTITLEVRADDGELAGPWAKAQAVVANTPPDAPKAAILPVEPRTVDTLFGALVAPATDADGDRLSYRFSFTKDGKKVDAGPDGREVHGLKKGETYEFEIIANDGEADSAPARAKVTIHNTRPTGPAISFANATPLVGEAVGVKIDRPSLDADGDAVTYDYSWLVNGKPAGLAKDVRSIPAGRIKKHEVWTVEVTPSDGEENGPTGKSRLVAGNTPPTAPAVSLDPSDPTAESGVRARLDKPAVDADGDAVTYRYAWYKDGARLDLPPDAATVVPGAMRRGDLLRVEVTPYDGEVEGPTATASARVKNSPPTAPQIALQPEKPTVRDVLVCAVKVAAKDPDRETPKLRFSWKRDGEAVPTSADQDKIAAGVARHGETWSCEVVATDGELTSAPVQAQVKINNAAPGPAKVVIEPEAPRAGQDLVCRLAAPAEDADNDPITYAYRWLAGGKPIAVEGREPWLMPASNGKKGMAFECEVVASDLQLKGPAAKAESRYRNTPPTVPLVRLAPEPAIAGKNLTCEIAKPATDPDGDAIKYRYTWQKNGVDQTFAPQSAEVPGRLVKAGDIWRCTVTAGDGEAEGGPGRSVELIIQNAAPSH